MKDILFTFQEEAVLALHSRIDRAHMMWSEDEPQVISFSAPTGSGKTLMMITLFEEILFGNDSRLPERDSIFVWLSDSPYLNEQTKMKIESKSDKILVRNLITIDSTFRGEYLDGGCIYFLNTQKLGTDKLLITESDVRSFSIWTTLTNTVKRDPKKLYFIIDEAHRGTLVSDTEAKKAQSIMQKFIVGSPDDGLCAMPLVIGVTATPVRFDTMVTEATGNAPHKVKVKPEDVQASGLLKDRINIHYPTIALGADMTMLQGAIDNWKEKCTHWARYCDHERERIVEPVLVVQVEDGTTAEPTKTNLAVCLEMLMTSLNRKLLPGEVVHTFNDYPNLIINGIEVQRIEPSRIEDTEGVKIVFFKLNLSTGWDCPRAETMMSFRSAQDYTYIAQLLGRMIRTPLARRITSDAELNNVGLFLPFYNATTVQDVIEALRNSEAIVPSDTGLGSEMIVLRRDPHYGDVFAAIEKMCLVTTVFESAHKMNPIKAYMHLARNLTMDDIAPQALKSARYALLNKIDEEVEHLRASDDYAQMAASITGLPLGTITYDYGTCTYSYREDTQEMTILPFDINQNFELAGRILSEGLHKDYWRRHYDRHDDIAVQTELMVLTRNVAAMDRLISFAESEFQILYNKFKFDIRALGEKRKESYARLINATARATEVPWELPDTIDFSVSNSSIAFPKHMYQQQDGTFRATLNPWEAGVLQEELDNMAVCWIRNQDRKKWSIAIPYEASGVQVPMYPDLIVVKVVHGNYVVDILEPHDPSRKDNYPKAVGLAKFAMKHWDKFGRIQLIRKLPGPDRQEHFYRLDMSDSSVRQRVIGVTSNQELDHIFDEDAILED